MAEHVENSSVQARQSVTALASPRIIQDVDTGLYLSSVHNGEPLWTAHRDLALTFPEPATALRLWRSNPRLKRRNIDTPFWDHEPVANHRGDAA